MAVMFEREQRGHSGWSHLKKRGSSVDEVKKQEPNNKGCGQREDMGCGLSCRKNRQIQDG